MPKEKEPKCICKKCPSFVECNGIAFCFTGKSGCIKDENGCICMTCPVQKKFKFTKVYYCIRGSNKDYKN